MPGRFDFPTGSFRRVVLVAVVVSALALRFPYHAEIIVDFRGIRCDGERQLQMPGCLGELALRTQSDAEVVVSFRGVWIDDERPPVVLSRLVGRAAGIEGVCQPQVSSFVVWSQRGSDAELANRLLELAQSLKRAAQIVASFGVLRPKANRLPQVDLGILRPSGGQVTGGEPVARFGIV
jgi:hypothetical protein